MSKKKKRSKSKLVATDRKTTKSKVVVTKKDQLQPTKSRAKTAIKQEYGEVPLLYGKRNFIFILGGIALIALGMLLMAGGSMPSPDVWDESIIYGFRRITLAPISILLGLAVVLYSIFAPANNNV
jgi:hypothetical protein